jgi:hypothetical protein
MQTNVEVELSCAGMTRKEANQVVKNLLPKYEEGLKTASTGKCYTECFDLSTGTAKPEYVDFVAAMKQQLAEAGIDL